MSGLADLIRSVVALADDVTSTLQATVQHESATDALTAYGAVVYATAVPRKAFVQYLERLNKTNDGRNVDDIARIVFLTPTAVDPRDRFTLPNGVAVTVARLGGVADPDSLSGASFYTDVVVGPTKTGVVRDS